MARVGRRLEAGMESSQLEAIGPENRGALSSLLVTCPGNSPSPARCREGDAPRARMKRQARSAARTQGDRISSRRDRAGENRSRGRSRLVLPSSPRKGYVAPEVLEDYLPEPRCLWSDQSWRRAERFPASGGQVRVWHGRGELGHARDFAARLLGWRRAQECKPGPRPIIPMANLVRGGE